MPTRFILKLLHKLVAMAVVACMVKWTHSAEERTRLSKSRGGNEPNVCLQLAGDSALSSAYLGYHGGHCWSVSTAKWTIKTIDT